MEETQYEGFYTFDELRDRGWHPGTIRHLFGNPSKVLYINKRATELYSKDKAQQMESAASFPRIQEDAVKESKKRYIEKLRDAERTHFEILHPLTKEALKNKALKHYNRRKRQDPHRLPLIPPPGFWENIMVEYLLSNYLQEFELARFRSRGAEKIQEIRTERRLEAIADAYPFLTDECRKRVFQARDALAEQPMRASGS